MDVFLNDDDYKTILKRRFHLNNSVDFVSADIAPLTNDIMEGFMGSYFILTLKYTVDSQSGEEHFFLKAVPQRGSTATGIATERNVCEKEIFFYDFLLREFEALGLDTTFAPKCFYCKDKKVMVLENLTDKNYKLAKKFQFWDLKQCKTGLETVAKFNGCSLIYEAKLNVKLGAKYPEIFKENYFPINEQSFGNSIFNSTISSIEVLTEKLCFDNNKKHKFLEKLKNFKIVKLLNENDFKKCLGHGDFWFNNIFFSENPSNCCIIDYQTLRYSPPAFDVLLFIYLNTTRAFRASNLRQLLQHYYSSLRAIVEANGYEMSGVLSEEEFKKSVQYVRSAVLFNVFMINAFVLMSNTMLKELCDEADQYDDWTEGNIIAFKRAIEEDEDYRTVVVENLNELYESLFEDEKCQF